jgi:hypothetical protein
MQFPVWSSSAGLIIYLSLHQRNNFCPHSSLGTEIGVKERGNRAESSHHHSTGVRLRSKLAQMLTKALFNIHRILAI